MAKHPAEGGERPRRRSRAHHAGRAGASPLALPAVAVAAALWALGGVVASVLFDAGVTPIQLAGARALLAATGLALVPASWARRGSDVAAVVALGIALGLVTASYYVAIERLTVAIAIVLQYTAPALVVVWAVVAERRPPSRAVFGALLGALAGVALVAGVPSGARGAGDVVGVVAGLGAAVFFALYTVAGRRAGANYGPLGALLRGFTVAGVLWAVVLAPAGWPRPLLEAGNLPGVISVGILGTLVPFLLFVWAVGHTTPERAAIAATLEPVLAAVAAWLWLDQRLETPQVVGGVLVIGAVAWLQTARR